MKTETTKKKKPTPVQRNKYTADHREKARKYYMMGLSLSEIGKLLDGVPVRTLEKWQLADKWTALKDIENIKTKARDLKDGGKTYEEIADILKVNRVTVWRYIKEARQNNQ